jgi:hemoglobin
VSLSATTKPDLDNRREVEILVDDFYTRLLADPVLAPIFLDVAAIDLAVHLPHIKAYWCKLLLGEQGYQRHTMNIHRALHVQHALTGLEFQQWLDYFITTVDASYAGAQATRAKKIATSIANNMQAALSVQAVQA